MFDQFLSKVVAHRELVLLPVFGNDHFCLLSVSSSQVRYFEGLSKGSASCWAAAEQLCKAMGVTMPEDKHNVYKQVGAECAMFVVHCAEAELRELHDEHHALVGWPDSMRMRALRERVGAWCAGLERERKNGAKEWRDELAERHKRVAMWMSAAEAARKQKALSDEAMADAKPLADQILNRGASEHVTELPENFKFALEVLQEVRREQAEQRLIRRRELELMKNNDPVKASALSGEPSKPTGREHLDKQLSGHPEYAGMCKWDWCVELLEPNRIKDVYRVWKSRIHEKYAVAAVTWAVA